MEYLDVCDERGKPTGRIVTRELAHREGISLKEACVRLGFLSPERFDEVFHPEDMV